MQTAESRVNEAEPTSTSEPMKRAVVEIASPADARALASLIRTARNGAQRRVVVVTSGLPVSERQAWERRLSFWSNACGCHVGALFALLAAVTCLIAGRGTTGAVWSTVVADLGFVLAAALVGKAAGILAARGMLSLDARRLGRRISALSPKNAEP